MRGVYILAILFVTLPGVLAQIENYNNYSVLEIEAEVTSSLYTKGPGTRIDDLKVNLTFIPRNEGKRQILLSKESYSQPLAVMLEKEEYTQFYWKDPRASFYRYNVTATLKTINDFNKIRRKIDFPLREVPREFKGYLDPTTFSDFNEAIRKQASEIIGGETDYYKVIYKLATWVEENIAYNLSTLTAEAVQTSSWTLENRNGVCDELTNLYISFLRTVGIPARFVGGQVYTNLDHTFGNHGWAEVYYPEEGWIPVDVTFGQVGWIDPTHIKYKHSPDAGDPSAETFWKTFDVDFVLNPIVVKSRIIKAEGEVEKQVGLLAEPLKKRVGKGSYVPIMVTVINPHDYYVPLLLHVTKAPKLIGKNKKILLLSPLEEIQVFWLIKIPEEVKENVLYTTTFETQTVFGTKTITEIQYDSTSESYTQDWAKTQIELLKPRSDKEFFPDVTLTCAVDKPYYYQTESATLQCNIKNIGNIALTNIKTCYVKDCQNVDLTINEEKQLRWEVPLFGFKDERLIVSAESLHMVKQTHTLIDIIEVPNIQIQTFQPTSVPYNTETNFSFLLVTNGSAKNMVFEIKDFGVSTLSRLDDTYEVLIPFNSKKFIREEIEVILTYEDIVGKVYMQEETFTLHVTEKPWYIRFRLWIEGYLN